MRAKSRAIRSSAKSPPRFPGFPSSSSRSRRWARRRAFFLPIPKPIGAGPPKRRFKARVSNRFRPRPRTPSGSSPSIGRRRAQGRFGPAAPGASSRVSTILTPATPTPRRSTTSPAARTVFRSCSPARSAPTAMASGVSIRRRSTRLLRACVSTPGAIFELDLGRDGPHQALVFAALIERSGAKPDDCAVFFWPRSFRRFGPRTVPGRLEGSRGAPFSRPRSDCGACGFRAPVLAADARAVHAAGGSPAQELAFALAAAVSLLRLLETAGTRLPKPAGSSRSVWRPTRMNSRPCRNSAPCESSGRGSRTRAASSLAPAHVHAESAWRMMTARDPTVNVMRGAMAAFSAGLGGADSVSVLPHTLAAGLPDSLARRLARNAQLILLRESNLGFVADPAAGSGAFEALTKALCEQRVGRCFRRSKREGGLPSALAERRLPASGRRLRGRAQPRRRPTEVADHRRQRARRSRRATGRACRWRARA